MTREELEKAISELMDSNTTITLACSLEDVPWAAAVYYARRDFDLVFFSDRSSRHSQAFRKNPQAAGAIHGQYSTWQEIKGLQLAGTVERITSVIERAKAAAVYLKRYPFVRQFLTEPEALSIDVAAGVAGVSLYVFRTRTVRYVSNAEGFGIRWRLEISDGRPVGEPVRE